MKRTISIVLTAVLCFSALTACSTAKTQKDTTPDTPDTSAAEITTEPETDNPDSGEGENTQIPNPWTDCTSLDDLNAAAGTALHAPTGLDVTDENYSYLNADGYTMAQYVFIYNGGEYTLRAANTQDDISGVYQDGKTLTELAEEDSDKLFFTTDENALWSRWFNDDMQYSLYATNASVEDCTAVRAALQ